MTETKYGPWIESTLHPTERWREVYGPFDCENDVEGGPVVFYCDDCGDCLACNVNGETWDGHDHRAIEYEDGLTARDRSKREPTGEIEYDA